MVNYFVGPGGNNSNSGLSWALRRLTLTSIETLVAAGDVVYVAPGVYRETLTAGVSGGSQYITGTVSVTNGSAVITGSGTLWLANAFADGQFRTTSLASGSDGVANGTTTFTSAAGNFQAGHVGLVIQVAGKAAYTITAVGSATSITLSGSPSAGSSLAYSIMTPAPIEIQSVDSNTQITLKQPWTYPSFTGLAYETYKDIKYIADVTGVNTDGVGGAVRITGSNDDQTVTRTSCIDLSTMSYRTFRGLDLDLASAQLVLGNNADVIFEDCYLHEAVQANGFLIQSANQLRWTIRRCDIIGIGATPVSLSHSSTVSNANHIIENCVCIGRTSSVNTVRVGGVLVRNCTFPAGATAVQIGFAIATGQSVHVTNCIISEVAGGLTAVNTSEIMEDYNAIFASGTARTNVATGSHSNTFPSLFQPQLLQKGSIFILIPYALSSYSPLTSIAGLNQPYLDLYGTIRAATSSWGAVQYEATRRPTDAGYSRKAA